MQKDASVLCLGVGGWVGRIAIPLVHVDLKIEKTHHKIGQKGGSFCGAPPDLLPFILFYDEFFLF